MIFAYLTIGLSSLSIVLLALLIRKRGKAIEAAVLSNPPTFVELIENKPLVVKVDDKYNFVVRHPSSIRSIQYLSRLRQLFATLRDVQKKEYTRTVEKMIQGLYVAVAYVLYNMSKDEYRGLKRLGYRKAIILKAILCTEWITELVSQVNDFWRLIKKKEQYQAAGVTLRSINGEGFTWDLWKKVSRFTN
jgi:hypothetical protein